MSFLLFFKHQTELI